MRKCLLFVALLVCQFTNTYAQNPDTLFVAPDTVCVRQPIQLVSNAIFPQTNYWGFCSGYLSNNAQGSFMGFNFGFQGASDINIDRDNGNYYGFVTNSATGELVRLEYGSSLENTPTFTNLGTLDGKMPISPNALYIVHDVPKNNWHVFILGGVDFASSSITRVDFGSSLTNNAPNIANMGNVRNTMNVPTGLWIQQDPNTKLWRGWCVNQGDNSITYFDFFDNISYTPIPANLGNINNAFNGPSDLTGILDNNQWFLFVTNETDNTLTRVDLAFDLDNQFPNAVNIGNPDSRLFGPTSISMTRDCDDLLAFVTNGTTNEFVRVSMPVAFGPYAGGTYGTSMIPAQLNGPTGLSKIIRNQGQDDIYAYVTNSNLSLSQVKFPHCTNTSISSSYSYVPPVYSYDTPGLFNVYYVVDEGLSTMEVECKQIRVVRIPDMELSNDTTICQGDTIWLRSFSGAADTIRWRPGSTLTDTTAFNVRAFPSYTTEYRIYMVFPTGCKVDTGVTVNVGKIKADAGPDRELADGASTILGGPYNSFSHDSGVYEYRWFPYQYINDTALAYPTVSPIHDFTYYLEVTMQLNDTHQCKAIDTVVVLVTCEDLNLPNAFAPDGDNPVTKTFGLINRQISKLTYFRIYDRWGKLVFYTTDPVQKWDGTFEGKPVEMGVYVWDADGFCSGGKRVRKSGNVTLLR
jgi:gliding motility-associated-like protein